ncbi:hypothetical protein FH972_008014 [Carpinus fangiana]|uniref:AMP-dependent synthetase/ligase domain-containing protein n=1 Tax=Carpinus fangiana TaxID=176857 RepID=A0A5N6QYY7_9ROSI|nr:hypothetical protein FH972_008014 [Carpinus fangiana]
MEKLKLRPANSSPLTPLGFLERAATVYGDCPSIAYDDTTYTWSQTHRRCLRVASSISSLGIKRGHVVSVLSPNVPAMYELHFAVPMAGAILNTINVRLDARMVSILLLHSESKLVFVDCLSRSLVNEAVAFFPPHVQPPLLILITDDEVPPTPSSSSAVHFYDTYEGVVEKGDPEFKWVRPDSEWDPMVLNYTSGTTSSPKGVVHCHRGLFIAALNALLDWSVSNQPVFLWTLPMFHSNGWSFSWGMAAVGGTNVCLRRFDAPIIYRLIERHGVSRMCGAPVVLNMLSNSPTNQPLRNPVHILTAGAPPPASILLRAEDRSKDVIISGGENLSSVEVESVLYTHPAVNEAAVVARPDEFWGETPCAFVSLKVGNGTSTGNPTEKEIMEFCRAKLPHYMVPKTVVFKDELPKTSTGKIQKFVLREIARAMGSSRASRI